MAIGWTTGCPHVVALQMAPISITAPGQQACQVPGSSIAHLQQPWRPQDTRAPHATCDSVVPPPPWLSWLLCCACWPRLVSLGSPAAVMGPGCRSGASGRSQQAPATLGHRHKGGWLLLGKGRACLPNTDSCQHATGKPPAQCLRGPRSIEAQKHRSTEGSLRLGLRLRCRLSQARIQAWSRHQGITLA